MHIICKICVLTVSMFMPLYMHIQFDIYSFLKFPLLHLYSYFLTSISSLVFFLSFFFNFFLLFLFYFTILYWFCHTSICIRHGCTHVPHPEPPSLIPPHTIPLGHPSAPAPAPGISSLKRSFVSLQIYNLYFGITVQIWCSLLDAVGLS